MATLLKMFRGKFGRRRIQSRWPQGLMSPVQDTRRRTESKFWSQRSLDQKLPRGLGREDHGAEQAAKFGSLCQMAAGMAF